MNITIEQARAFHAIAKLGTIQKAATSLNKGHSAVMYLVKSLEDQLQIPLFDRSGYRNRMTQEGKVILKHCEQLLTTHDNIQSICSKIKDGWEPKLKLIYDGVVDFNIICDALLKLNESQVPTELTVLSSHLDDVENIFIDSAADMMVTVLPIKKSDMVSIKMKPIRMFLVAHKSHMLSQSKKKRIENAKLNNHTLVKIKGGGNRLGLSTEIIETGSTFSVNDFKTKKQALMRGLGYGWMPDYMIKTELKNKELNKLKTQISAESTVHPRLYYKSEELLGNTARQLIKYLRTN